MLKKIVVFLPILIFFIVPNVSRADFSDLNENSPYYESIKHLSGSALGDNITIELGYSDGTFRPYTPITRAEFVAIAVGKDSTSASYSESRDDPEFDIDIEAKNCFPDVHQESFAPFICTALKQGIVNGYPDGKFRPDQNITFIEAAAIVARAENLPTDKYKNDKEPWYYKFVKAIEEAGAIPLSITGFNHIVTNSEAAYIIALGYPEYASLTYEDVLYIEGLKSKKNFFKKSFSRIFHSVFQRELKLKNMPSNIDIASFKQLSGMPLSIWWKFRELEIIFGTTSPELIKERAMPGLYRDVNNIYCYSPKTNKLSTMNADSKTFEIFENNHYGFAADNNHIWGLNETTDCASPVSDISGGKKRFHKNIYTDNQYVYYFDQFNKGEKFVKVEGADAKTFAFYEGNSKFGDGLVLFQDKKSIYFYANQTSLYLKDLKVDKDTFEVITEDPYDSERYMLSFKDKNGIYFGMPYAMDKKKRFSKADPKTFKLLLTESWPSSVVMAVDKNALYSVDYRGKLKKLYGVDMGTYETVLNETFPTEIILGRDRNRVYDMTNLSVLDWADAKTFEISGNYYLGVADSFIYGKDKDHYWYIGTEGIIPVQELDPDSFEIVTKAVFSHPDKNILKQGLIIKDNSSVWQYDPQDGMLQKIQDLDSATLEVKKFQGEFYLKDKNSVWILSEDGMSKIDSADTTTFFIRDFEKKQQDPSVKSLVLFLESETALDTYYSVNLKTGQIKSVVLPIPMGSLEDIRSTYPDADFIVSASTYSILSGYAAGYNHLYGLYGDLYIFAGDSFDEINSDSIKDFTAEDESNSTVGGEGTLFIIRSTDGSFYKVGTKVYSKTGEIVFKYASIEVVK